jgi:hypothetical protein
MNPSAAARRSMSMDGVGIGELTDDWWIFVRQWFVKALSDMLKRNP